MLERFGVFILKRNTPGAKWEFVDSSPWRSCAKRIAGEYVDGETRACIVEARTGKRVEVFQNTILNGVDLNGVRRR